ncbi:hypothetical protein GCM10022233_79140 [Streptomyces shaanxiensis]|uniref:Alpha-galactosidase n=1 Tax=Streptomyces shaanxiensis TaxID=653357 RepID=A0ABP7WAZ9_9ACTN
MRHLHIRTTRKARRRAVGALAAALLCAAGLAVPTATAAPVAPTLDDGLALTPPMGFNNWNSTHCRAEFDEAMVKGIADIFVDKGLKDAGYEYVNLDDCWALPNRDANGQLVPDPVRFPGGINGESAAGDGQPITVGGVVYDNGLGVHAQSTVEYYTGGGCETVTADVGVDDEEGAGGTVTFEIWTDDTRAASTGLLTNAMPAQPITADVTGAQVVRFVVTDGGDGIDSDHGDWAEARVSC